MLSQKDIVMSLTYSFDLINSLSKKNMGPTLHWTFNLSPRFLHLFIYF
jgi:hypothetical protein